MTLRVTITNEDTSDTHVLQVNVFDHEMGAPKNIKGECRELAAGESYSVTLWGSRGVMLAEQSVGN